MKRLFSLLLALLMIPVGSAFSELFIGVDMSYRYEINGINTVRIVHFPNSNVPYVKAHMEIPETIDGMTVTELAPNCFSGQEALEEIVIPPTVRIIGESAFRNCENLKTVRLPEGLVSIGDMAFFRCPALEEITLPESLEVIGREAFYECAALTELKLPSGLKSIGDSAFHQVPAFKSEPRDLYDIPEQPEYQENGEFRYLVREDGSAEITGILDRDAKKIRIPAEIDGHPVKALTGDSVEMYYLPFKGALEGCWKAKSIELPEGLEELGPRALAGTKAKNIRLPSTMKTIRAYAFDSAKVEEVTIPDSVTEIEPYSFNQCSLKKLTLGAGMKRIPDFAFRGSHIKKLILSDWVEEIGTGSFMMTGCESIAFGKGLKRIGFAAFWHCGAMKELKLPETLETLEPSAFSESGRLESVEIPGNIREIPDHAFQGCGMLKKLTLGEGVRVVGAHAFANCLIKSVKLPSSMRALEEEAFSTQGDPSWRRQKTLTSITLNDGLEEIGNGAFYSHQTPKIVIPASVRYIGIGAMLPRSTLNKAEIIFKGTDTNFHASAFGMRMIGKEGYYGNRLVVFTCIRDSEVDRLLQSSVAELIPAEKMKIRYSKKK